MTASAFAGCGYVTQSPRFSKRSGRLDLPALRRGGLLLGFSMLSIFWIPERDAKLIYSALLALIFTLEIFSYAIARSHMKQLEACADAYTKDVPLKALMSSTDIQEGDKIKREDD